MPFMREKPEAKGGSQSPPELHIDEKWDKVINVVFTRSTTGLFLGGLSGLLLFRTSRAPNSWQLVMG
jgi:Domain of unknown function (DUF543)